MPDQHEKPAEGRDVGTPTAVAGYYFFSLAGLAIAYPYLPLYWRSLNYSGAQLGALLTALGLGGLIAQAPLGYLSDRGGKRRRFIVGAMSIGGFTMLAYGMCHSFWLLLLATMVQSACFRSADALVQALVGDWVSGTRMASVYGKLRIAGSVGWFASLMLSAWFAFMTDTRPIPAANWTAPMFLVVAGFNFAAAGSILLARSRPAVSRLHLGPVGALKAVVKTPGIGRFLLAVLLFWTGLQSVSSFLSLYLKEMGAGHEIISSAFIVSAIAETPFILLAGRMAKAWGERRLLLFAFAWMPVRLFLYAVMPSPGWVFLPQVLHSITYGLALVGAITLMNHRLPDNLRASGQGALGVVMSAANTAAPFFGAFIAQLWGYRGVFATMSVVAIAGGIILAGVPAAAPETDTSQASPEITG